MTSVLGAGAWTRERAGDRAVEGVGSPSARLLAGPTPTLGAEGLEAHERRLGPLSIASTPPEQLRRMIADSDLRGRGGGGFPTVKKLDAAAATGRPGIVVVNASEGEPASRKDKTLCELRPHLILDGASVIARAVNAKRVVLYHHGDHHAPTRALTQALRERGDQHLDIELVDAPMRYVAGETNAIVSYLEGSGALPRRRSLPVASAGVAGAPTIVNNAETVAHVALIARFGSDWFKAAGDEHTPGSSLLTLAGELARPGTVVELLRPIPLGQLLAGVGGLEVLPQAVLVGGYAGTWLRAESAWRLPLARDALGAAGASFGCGVIAPIAASSCGIATTARILRWLADGSSGQCGPCVFGLDEIASIVEALARGGAGRRDLRRLQSLLASVYGRGACGHPNGVVRLVESALETFSDEVAAHLRGRSCAPTTAGMPLLTDRASR